MDDVTNTSNVVIEETNWVNPPKLSDLQQNYDDAKIEHDKQASVLNVWRDNFSITGSAKLKKIPNRSNVQPRLIRKQAEWRYPALSEPFLSTENVFKVQPRTYADVKRAQQNELVLNYQFNTKVQRVAFIDAFVREMVNEGTAIIRVGWKYDSIEVETEKPVYEFLSVSSPDEKEAIQRKYMLLLQLSQTDPNTFKQNADAGTQQAIQYLLQTGILVVPKQVGTEIVTEKQLIENHPTAEVCEFDNVIIDPSCNGDIDKANFVIYNFETSKSDLKKSGISYKNLDKIQVTNTESTTSNPDYTPGADISSFELKDDSRAKFVATEYCGYWDYDNSGIAKPIIATWVGNTLIRMEESPYPDRKLPYVIVKMMPVKRSLYGEPDGELIADNQKIVGAVTRGMIDLMGRSAAGQTGYRKDYLDVTNKRLFLKGQDYSFNASVDPRLGVFQHSYPEIPSSAFNMLQLQNAEAESLSGVKAYNSGINGDAFGQVAAGVRGVLDATSRRDLSILRRMSDGIIAIGRKFISMNAEFLSDEEVIRITDEQFVTVMRDDLSGEYDIKLTISSAEADNAKAQELAFMLQTGAASADPQEVRMIRAEIARLRNMPDLAKRIESYTPQPDPMAVKQQQLQLLLLQAQIQNELAQAKERTSGANMQQINAIEKQANAQLLQAKASTEQAKTRNLHSNSDLQDLNYLEQERGVKQARDVQKIQAQANSQAKLKMVEAILNPPQPTQAAK